MAFNIALLDIIACPLCKGRLKLDKTNQQLICTFDRLAYPIKQDIPVLLSSESRELSAAEVEPWLL
ncbi:Trm112 family protein [Rheinheimera sp. 4Y26]|uniref:Trm112 family protein n=1 Tax=Rheinheimera sp. 4Y26 TaxID=2977811 RepID=UPI0021B095DD|nr:Trm112 family protein [Rheinheimera sp. 4Y26]MCT6699711.1 Trm112 family protein [Rheinheimera sp. 4Y26]